jgi:hypothetical protein
MFKNLTPAEYEVLLRHDFATFAMRSVPGPLGPCPSLPASVPGFLATHQTAKWSL